MNVTEFKKNYLNHYILLEQDFKSTIEFVTVSEENFNTYSVTYLKLLLTIGSEIDVMLDFLSKLYDPSSRASGFGCSKIISKYEPNIKSLHLEIKNEDISIFPWNYEEIPDWWTIYNKIKHNRNEIAVKFNPTLKYYQFANLKNVLYSLAALYSLELYAYRLISIANNEEPFVPLIKSMFVVKNSYWKDIEFGNGSIFVDGALYLND